jgi:hypothetical protein
VPAASEAGFARVTQDERPRVGCWRRTLDLIQRLGLAYVKADRIVGTRRVSSPP